MKSRQKLIGLLLISFFIFGCSTPSQNTIEPQITIEEPSQETEITPKTVEKDKSSINLPDNYTVHCNPFTGYQFIHPRNYQNYQWQIFNQEGYQTYLTPHDIDKTNKPSISVLHSSDDTLIEAVDSLADNVKEITLDNSPGFLVSLPSIERRIIQNKKGVFQIDLSHFTESENDIKENFINSFSFASNQEQCLSRPYKPTIINNYLYQDTQLIAEQKDSNITFTDSDSQFKIQNSKLNLFQKDHMLDSKYYYKGLSINLPNKRYQNQKIIYQCTSPLLANQPYFDCQTNNSDFLTQYEFGKDYYQFSTGGGFPLTWKKIYIKRINGIEIVFEGQLAADNYWPTDDNTQELIDRIESKEYLEYIKSLPINKYNEQVWEQIVESFDIYKTHTSTNKNTKSVYARDSFSFEHNPNLHITPHPDDPSAIIISTIDSSDIEPKDGLSGSDFMIDFSWSHSLDAGEWIQQTQWPYSPIGEVLEEGYMPINGIRSYQRIHEGLGFLATYKEKQTHHTVFYPLNDGESLFQITLQTRSENYSNALENFLEIIEFLKLKSQNSAVDPNTFNLNNKTQGPAELNFYRHETSPGSSISFYYKGGIIRQDSNKIYQVFIDPTTNKREVNTQDAIELIQKDPSQSFLHSIEELISKHATNANDCEIKIESTDNGLKAYVEYIKEFQFDKSQCDSEPDEVACSMIQLEDYYQEAKTICSHYQKSGFDNYFLYQPNNSKRQMIFVNHIFGLDAKPWIEDTIRL